MISIAAFDCEKRVDLPGVPPSAGPIAPGAGIRAWHGGGPLGASWNAFDLRCTVRVETRCRSGKLGVALRVGSTVVGELVRDVHSPVDDVELVVPQKAWKRALDESTRRVATGLPIRTGIFRALATIDCDAPGRMSLAESGYAGAAADSAFVAGFAWGE